MAKRSIPTGLLREYVRRHNQGIRSNNFLSLLELFGRDATLVFKGRSNLTLAGKEAIAGAFHRIPPTTEIVLLEVAEDDQGMSAGYKWDDDPNRQAGILTITVKDGKIDSMVITTE